MQVWNVLRAARWKYSTQKIAKKFVGTIPQICRAISSQLKNVSTIGKKLVRQHISSTCPHNMVNFGPLAAEICWRVWGTPANFNGFRVLAAFLHGTRVLGVSQTLRRWTEGATYIRQGGHHVEHWPTFLVFLCFMYCLNIVLPFSYSVLWPPSWNKYLLTYRWDSYFVLHISYTFTDEKEAYTAADAGTRSVQQCWLCPISICVLGENIFMKETKSYECMESKLIYGFAS